LSRKRTFFFLDGSFICYDGLEWMEGFGLESVLSLGEKAVMVRFAVSEEKNRWLQERMEALGIHEKDIEEKFVRSSGRGGQKVNKASTCVYLRHIPTRVEIKCMKERSQSINRFLARRELVRRVEKGLGGVTPENMATEKARRQKSKREKRAKLKYRKDTGPADVEFE
jgi:protein subunit release factor B